MNIFRQARAFYFYPRSPCGERRKITITIDDGTFISIHALLAESDPTNFTILCRLKRISIHALLAESDDDILAGVNELLISIHALLAESDIQKDGTRQNGQ